MRLATGLATLCLCLVMTAPILAQPGSGRPSGAEPALSFEERLKRLEERDALRERREREAMPPGVERPEVLRPEVSPEEPGIGPLPEVGRERRAEKQPALSFSSTGSGRLLYAKPFVSSPKAILGGYMDFQYRTQKVGTIDNGYGGISSNFDQQRFVPFIYADITENVKMAAELEIEHGIREEGGPDREVEFGLEFATIDYLIKEPINLRAGIILLPVGKFNLLHDSPLNDLTDRPLVSQFIIP